jgi:signal transduction histidine kinase
VHNLLTASEMDLNGDGKNDKIPAADTTSLARYQGIEQQRLGEFYRAAGPRAKGLYYTTVYGPAVDRADRITSNLLQQRPPKATAHDWDVAQGYRIKELHQVESQLSEDLGHSADALRSQARTSAWITGGSAVGLAVLTFVAAMLLALRISKRLRLLRRDALQAAEDTLPKAVATMTDARSEKQVTDAVDAAEHLAMTDRTGPNDEVAAVTQAFNVVHRQALRLAADQAMLRLDVAAMMIALARRGQSLVQRQLHMLDEFTEATRDPVGLERMRSLNHMASRMRRNEENLLLLAGGDPGRRHISAITVARAVTEASAEIEDSSRIAIEDSADTPIIASAVGDVVHLLAELLENAAQFSAPTTHVRVATRRTIHEVVISINDEGIGLPEEQVAEINERLREPSGLTSSLAGTMGLLVVARLAERHGIDVQLHSTAGKGTLAVVRVPEALIASQDGPRTGSGSGSARGGMIDPISNEPPLSGRGSLKALSDRPSAIPVTGTGEETSITDSSGVIVPRPRIPGAEAADPRPLPAPVSAAPDPTATSAQTGWFMPATGSGDFPALPPGSLSWQTGAGDMAYDQARQAIAAASEHPAPEAPVEEEGALPKRRPGARLLPGSVEAPASAPPPRGGPGDEGFDPDEIRSRLAGFAGGIAAADTSSTMDIRQATDKS